MKLSIINLVVIFTALLAGSDTKAEPSRIENIESWANRILEKELVTPTRCIELEYKGMHVVACTIIYRAEDKHVFITETAVCDDTKKECGKNSKWILVKRTKLFGV